MIQTQVKLNFTGQPTINETISYGLFVDGSGIVYNNGLNYLNVHYVDSADPIVPPDEIPLGATKSETIDNTLSFLDAFWGHPNIVYTRDADNIYSTLITDVYPGNSYSDSPNINVSISFTTVGNGFVPVYLRYFFEYANIVNDVYRCEIYTKTQFLPTTEIHGRVAIEKGATKDHLDPIKGTGLSIELEATVDVSLEDLYTEDEHQFTVRLYKNNKIIFKGFLKPDGVFQSYTRDVWKLSLTCVDGLGSLDNLSFVKENGLRFFGKMKAIDIVYNCLRRTGVFLNINTAINTVYNGLTVTSDLDILNKIYLDSNRFFKNDGQTTGDGTFMSCGEVLISVLDLFCACITQENGEWYIYKPNELSHNRNVIFKRYSTSNVYLGNTTKKLDKKIGSQIDNFYPHHCGGNQQIEIRGGISAFRISYKYSFAKGLLSNGDLSHDGNLNYAGWTIDPTNEPLLINDPLDATGFKFKPVTNTTTLIATSNPISLFAGTTLDFNFSVKYNGNTQFMFYVKAGAYYLKSSGEWTTTPTKLILPVVPNSFDTGTTSRITHSQPLPADSTVIVEVFVPLEASINKATLAEVRSIDIVNTFQGDNVIGEFHTVTRKNRVSSLVKDNKTIFNGDNPSIVYLGAIYKEDSITVTDLWTRIGYVELKPILRISAEDELRMCQKPAKLFSGGFYGYYPFMSVVEINKIEGEFMPIEYSYDTFSNIGTHKLLQLYGDEVPDIDYKLTYDFGNVVKPTIKG